MGRFLTGMLHAVAVWSTIAYYVSVYALRRFALLWSSTAAEKPERVARLQGEVLRRAMSQLGATFVKLGQVMSSRPDLFEPALITELKQLQDNLPPFPFSVVRTAIEAERDQPLNAIFSELDETPVAAASVAQVHRARLLDGREVAVKVLRPNVRTQVERDGAFLLFGARLLALHPVLRLSDPVGFTQEFVEGLARQTDLRVEAQNYTQFARNFAHDRRVVFPYVHEALCGERVLVMDFVRGAKVDALPPGDHRAVADALRSATMQMLFVDGFMHADMHPGNMVVRDDGVLVLFDVGLASKLNSEVLDMFVDLMKCISMGTPDDTIEHLRRYHVHRGNVDWAAMRRDFEAFGQKFRSQDVMKLDYGALTNDVLAIARRYRVHPVPELSLVVVGVVTAQGIGKQLNPDANDFIEMSKYLVPLLMRTGKRVPDTDEARRARAAAEASADEDASLHNAAAE
jgi:ubiquinone biosynthesis protein